MRHCRRWRLRRRGRKRECSHGIAAAESRRRRKRPLSLPMRTRPCASDPNDRVRQSRSGSVDIGAGSARQRHHANGWTAANLTFSGVDR